MLCFQIKKSWLSGQANEIVVFQIHANRGNKRGDSSESAGLMVFKPSIIFSHDQEHVYQMYSHFQS